MSKKYIFKKKKKKKGILGLTQCGISIADLRLLTSAPNGVIMTNYEQHIHAY